MLLNAHPAHRAGTYQISKWGDGGREHQELALGLVFLRGHSAAGPVSVKKKNWGLESRATTDMNFHFEGEVLLQDTQRYSQQEETGKNKSLLPFPAEVSL